MSADIKINELDLENPQDALLARQSAGAIKRFIFPPETVLFTKGDARHCAFLIDKGKVSIYGNDEGGPDKHLCTIGEGEIFGEMALIDDTPRTATAVTAEDAEIFVIPRDSLHERIKGLDPIISLLLSLLIERYRVTRIHLPESIKQDRLGDFIDKVSRHGQLPEEVLRLRNIKKQRAKALKEMKLEQELRAALEKREFVPVLQPILSLPDRRLVGYESLIRWQHPEKGLLTPNRFIPVAERTGVVSGLDKMMLEKACEILPRLKKAVSGKSAPYITINLSGINFGTLDIVESVAQIIEKTNADPSRLVLEITESALIGDPDLAEEVLAGLKALGLTIALDDFGTGYSSLGYLHRFSIDILKIDRSFIMNLHDGNKGLDIVKAIIALSRTFDLKVVAEGIENEKDIIALNSLDCDMGQGYLFSKPLPVDDALAFAVENRSG